MSMNVKSTLFRAFAVLLPLVVILIVEAAMRSIGVANDARRPFREVEGHEEHLILNAGYTQRYFNSFSPGVAFTPFAARKPDHTFRVFALGGSTTAGFPANGYAFPLLLRSRLESFLPEVRTEVVNLALTATNSFTLRDLSRDVVRHRPDAIVIYAGHNEYYGAFGAAASVNRLGNRAWLKRLVIRLKRFAIYTVLERVLGGLAPSRDVVGRTMMAEAVGEASVPVGGEVYEEGIRQFADNMSVAVGRFCGEGVPVYLATLTSNLADQPPLADSEPARRAYEEGLERLRVLDVDGARVRLEAARELDELRFRAPKEINGVIRRLAEGSCATLVDVESAFRRASLPGVEGSGLFVDHLHPNVRGHNLIAQSFFEAIVDHPRLSERSHLAVPVEPPDVDELDAAAAELRIARLLIGRPFVRGISPEEEAERYRAFVRRFARRGTIDSLAALMVLGEMPEDEAFSKAIGHAGEQGDTTAALKMYRSLLGRRPFSEDMARQAILYGRPSRSADALVRDIARMWANRSRDPFFVQVLAAELLDLGSEVDARRLLDWAGQRPSPEDFRTIVLQGDNLRRMGRLREAAGAYTAALALRPDDLSLQNNIATVYLQLGETTEAAARYRAVLASDSTFIEAWINLALLYARTGQRERANRMIARAVAIDPDHPMIHRLRSR